MAGGAPPALFAEAILLLGGAVVAAPLFKKLGLGTVLGYLAAGVVIGPVLRLITDAEAILQFSELGVVFLLFIIGLELKPARLWSLRRNIFGLGLLQVCVSGFALFALTIALTAQNLAASIVIGFGLALSSTAFALQILEERGELNRRHGQKAFAILLFQDLAIVPMLAVVPLLAPISNEEGGAGFEDLAIAVGAVAFLVLVGRYLLTPIFRIVGNAGAREAMIATALLIVLGAGYLMHVAGLSMAMGAFIAGVMLAESSYRHELEADIEPFRGLLLGLFFIAIGMSLDLTVLIDQWLTIIIAVPILMLVKAAIIYGLCRMFKIEHDISLRTALVLPQGGEFGFVLFSAAAAVGIFELQTASLLIAIVTLSMALTPLSVMLGSWLERNIIEEEIDQNFDDVDENTDILMIGFSRFGQIAAQILLAGGCNVTIIDHSAERVRAAGKFGFRIYFGDGTRKELLEAAGIKRARVIAVCTNKKEITDKIVDIVQSSYPDAHLYVRAYDRAHTLELRGKNVDYELRETFESGLVFGGKTLEALGISDTLATEIIDDVRKRDTERLRVQATDGITAGAHMVHTRPVTPEPLSKPDKEGKIVEFDADKNNKQTSSDAAE